MAAVVCTRSGLAVPSRARSASCISGALRKDSDDDHNDDAGASCDDDGCIQHEHREQLNSLVKWRIPRRALHEPAGEVDDVERGRGGEGADVGTARGRVGVMAWLATTSPATKLSVDEPYGVLYAGSMHGPISAQPALRGVMAIIDTINACTFDGTDVVATGAFAGSTPNGPASKPTRPNTDPTPLRVSTRRVGVTAW